MARVLALIELVFGSGSTVLLYFVLRAHMWRSYYRDRPHATSDPSRIDQGDKTIAALFAAVLGVFWFGSVPVYLIWRHHVAKQRRVAAGLYADRMMRRFNENPAYIEEYDERR